MTKSLFAMPSGPVPRERGWLQRPDCRIHYEVTGRGPALVFAHGLGGNHLSWWQQVAHFCDRYTCVTFSHRGFAPSEAPPGGPDPAEYAGDLGALVDHLGLGDVCVVAQSMGGWSALGWALTQPPALRALVLSATSGPIDPRQAGGDDGAAFREWAARAEAAREAARGRGVHQAIGARAATEQPALHFLYRAIDEMSSALDKEALRARMYRERSRPPSDLSSVTVPTLWITGAEDIVFASFVAPLMAAEMPRARHVEIPEAGHSAYFERAPAFNAVLEGFLAELG